MKLCIALSSTKVIFIEVDELGTVEDIKVLVQVETNIPMDLQTLISQGRVLQDSTPILESGLLEGEVIQLSSEANPLQKEALALLQQANTQPTFLNHLESQNPELASVIRSGNLLAIEQYLAEFIQKRQQLKQEKYQHEAALELDPLDPSNQKEIESRIQQKNIDENYKYAQEFTPEVFASVEMLYIDCKVNGRHVQAFVDSGAQNTIMSRKCAEKIDILRLVDVRFKGQAMGVGVDVIVGRIHAINLEIGGKFFNCCIHVLENAKIDMLFGLDMLKRHQCCIDLFKNVLTLNAGETSIPFLHSSEMLNKDEDSMEVDEEKKVKIEETKKEEIKKKEEPVKVQPEEKKKPETKKPLENVKPDSVKPIEDLRNQKIQKLLKLGYPQQECEAALDFFKGDEEKAASYLFTKSNPFDF